ncbi:hypothetical protein Mmar10_0135 [Maricaulis maris MCS10]|uniref:Lipoprotein n=1 Tax=Maricaulis maris (strain MCS10) TaxID=394221 RepID=Q0ATF6_MARMM|nr:hypothetical protein [Maricaulis maris]ABI64431.1 hypothetical protein Mmar10_0135 [Maricaulis maris MCS10]
MKTSKTMLMMMLASVTALGACAGHTSQPSPPPGPRPVINRPPPVAPDTVTPAINMCMVETLAEQRLEMLSEVHGYREAIRADALAGANVADTRTQEIIAAFETDLDASYRFATSSCRTYNRCLEENRFEEAACQDTAALWHDGQDRFHDLSETLADVRERIATGCTDCSAPRSQTRSRPRRHSDETIGSVFSTDGH